MAAVTARLREAGPGALAGLAGLGLADGLDRPVVVTGCRVAGRRRLTAAQKDADQLIALERAANGHGFAGLLWDGCAVWGLCGFTW
ncbi:MULTISPECIES: hypothetical protein [unclassified Streptomyces]|uniref:hypothetical protein n=1 Tax=unclassified Streptomyces TaxID=2593676 RepID=UPI002E815F21|nr:hypothetical protein [Streptomyces sp. NBC_00589]WTI42083.1 hypothetical protein OIC96_47615 [Streptomyces sp. NBC_00775]WUB24235.1 hypothetical protein OHA51_02100 [Streptomyces sp. NBC_00589]